jgi:ABC-2 type transport system permease protein
MPRIAGDVANFSSPLPTGAEIRLQKENAVHDSNQASVEKTQANEALEQKLLAEFKVEKIEDLPIDLAGARMIEQEATTNRLYHEIEQRVTDAKNRQNEIIGGFQFASPYMAIRAVSTSLAATDRTHHFDFVSDAENYRRQYVKDLNTSEMQKKSPGDSPESRRAFWDQVSAFQPRFASSLLDLRRCMVPMLCVAIWAVAAWVAALYACPNVNRSGKH